MKNSIARIFSWNDLHPRNMEKRMKEEERQYIFSKKKKRKVDSLQLENFLWKTCASMPAHVTIFYLVVSLVNEWSYTNGEKKN